MKKIIFLIPIVGLIIACSSGNQQDESTSDNLQEQTEMIENTTQKLDESIQNSEAGMKEAQNEIDSLLNNI